MERVLEGELHLAGSVKSTKKKLTWLAKDQDLVDVQVRTPSLPPSHRPSHRAQTKITRLSLTEHQAPLADPSAVRADARAKIMLLAW